MIIGIDDSGDFRRDLSYFNTVFIKPSVKHILKEDFRNWERQIRRERSIRGEVKGSNLGIEGLTSFVEKVFIPNKDSMWFLPFCTLGTNDRHQMNYCVHQRNHTLEQFETAIIFYQNRDRERSTIVIEYEQLRDWYRALNNEEILKVWTLGYVVPIAIKEAIDLSIFFGFDVELDQLSLSIDQSFISRREITTMNWKALLKSSIWQTLYTNPITMIDTWDNTHPFISRFVESMDGDKVVLNSNLRESILFVRSHEVFEVRIADIIAYITRRRNDNEQLKGIFNLLKPNIPHGRVRLLHLTTNPNLNVPSPYPPLPL